VSGITKPRRAAAVVALLCALALGACGAPAAGPRPKHHVAPVSLTRAKALPAISNEQLAKKVATQLLASLGLPRGSLPSAKGPKSLTTWWHPSLQAKTVDDHHYFWVPAEPSLVLNEVSVARGATPQGGITEGGSVDPPVWNWWSITYTWPARNGLYSEELVLQDERGARGGSVLRADSDVVWLPAKSKYDVVAAGAKVVTIVATRTTLNPAPHTVTTKVAVTDPAKIAAIKGLVNRQRVTLDVTLSCPAETGYETVQIAFRTSEKALPYSVVTVTPDCPWAVAIETGGHKGDPLTGAVQIIALLHRLVGLSLVRLGPGLSSPIAR
jgi:hypothetical protein